MPRAFLAAIVTVLAGLLAPAAGAAPVADLYLHADAAPRLAHPGDALALTFLVVNHGPEAGAGTIVDPLPPELRLLAPGTGCQAAPGRRVLLCRTPSLAAGERWTHRTRVTVSPSLRPFVGRAHSPRLRVTPIGTSAVLAPGESRTLTLACPSGALLTGAQAAGSPGVHVRAAGSTGPGTYAAVLASDGAATGSVAGACLSRRLVDPDGNTHTLVTTGVSGTRPLAAGTAPAAVSCPAGSVAVAPGFRAASGATERIAAISDPLLSTVLEAFQSGPGGASVQLSSRCLRLLSTTNGNHSHVVRIGRQLGTVAVPPGADAASTVACPAGYLALAGGADLPLSDVRTAAGAWTFTVHNPGAATQTAALYVLCARARSSTSGLAYQVENTSLVFPDGIDTFVPDDADSTPISLAPVLGLTGRARVAGRRLLVPAHCQARHPCRGRVTVSDGPRRLAGSRFSLRAGRRGTLRLALAAPASRVRGASAPTAVFAFTGGGRLTVPLRIAR